ncbi:DgyrCDS9982 [Dimorphilus gyrociliatus]|uniref:Beta-1,4-glucuronyltransferase 1 n=1 Tax=Dimorphilus gyrociliatus TaxID=2664684 RepID=A0A7I8VYS7_9ANNE|nr:DgyrCDS9982 [Dimorphilus gyrociliatus]
MAFCKQLTFRRSRIVICLVCFLLCIQVLNLALFHRMDSKKTNSRTGTDLLRNILETISSKTVMDTSGLYQIVKDVISRNRSVSLKQKLTIVTHCSADDLHYIIDLTRHWKGEVSISIFALDGKLANLVRNLVNIFYCYNMVNVNFHIVFPLPTRTVILTDVDEFFPNCTLPVRLERTSRYSKLLYPTNLLRNVALSSVSSEFFLMIDDSTLPNSDLYSHFRSEIDKGFLSKTAYILPSFEGDKNLNVPTSKAELNRHWLAGRVRPYGVRKCWDWEKPTDYQKWRTANKSYEVNWQSMWRPSFIARKSETPRFDERFFQYGFNRISQLNQKSVSCDIMRKRQRDKDRKEMEEKGVTI